MHVITRQYQIASLYLIIRAFVQFKDRLPCYNLEIVSPFRLMKEVPHRELQITRLRHISEMARWAK